MWSGETVRDWQRFKLPDQIMYAQKFWRKLVRRLRIEKKQEWAKGKTEARQCSKTERNLFYWARRQGIIGNSQKSEEKTGKTYGASHAVQEESTQHHESGCKAEQCIREEFQNKSRIHEDRSNQRNILNEHIQNQCIDMEIVLSFFDASRHPLLAWFLHEFGYLQEHETREFFECIQHDKKW